MDLNFDRQDNGAQTPARFDLQKVLDGLTVTNELTLDKLKGAEKVLDIESVDPQTPFNTRMCKVKEALGNILAEVNDIGAKLQAGSIQALDTSLGVRLTALLNKLEQTRNIILRDTVETEKSESRKAVTEPVTVTPSTESRTSFTTLSNPSRQRTYAWAFSKMEPDKWYTQAQVVDFLRESRTRYHAEKGDNQPKMTEEDFITRIAIFTWEGALLRNEQGLYRKPPLVTIESRARSVPLSDPSCRTQSTWAVSEMKPNQWYSRSEVIELLAESYKRYYEQKGLPYPILTPQVLGLRLRTLVGRGTLLKNKDGLYSIGQQAVERSDRGEVPYRAQQALKNIPIGQSFSFRELLLELNRRIRESLDQNPGPHGSGKKITLHNTTITREITKAVERGELYKDPNTRSYSRRQLS